MFGIDSATFQTLWPSLLVVGAMIGAMGWGVTRVLGLIRQSGQ